MLYDIKNNVAYVGKPLVYLLIFTRIFPSSEFSIFGIMKSLPYTESLISQGVLWSS